MSSHEVCGGKSPWKGDVQTVRRVLYLAKAGIDVAGLSDEAVGGLYEKTVNPLACQPEANNRTMNEEATL